LPLAVGWLSHRLFAVGRRSTLLHAAQRSRPLGSKRVPRRSARDSLAIRRHSIVIVRNRSGVRMRPARGAAQCTPNGCGVVSRATSARPALKNR